MEVLQSNPSKISIFRTKWKPKSYREGEKYVTLNKTSYKAVCVKKACLYAPNCDSFFLLCFLLRNVRGLASIFGITKHVHFQGTLCIVKDIQHNIGNYCMQCFFGEVLRSSFVIGILLRNSYMRFTGCTRIFYEHWIYRWWKKQ